MDTPKDHVVELESRLKLGGVKVHDVLVAANLDRSTWTRWKQGKLTPRMDSWMRVSAEAEARLAVSQSEAAAA